MKPCHLRLFSGLAVVRGWLLVAAALLIGPATCPAIIFHSTGDPAYNTTAPAGALAGSGWELQGRWGGFLGTPIAPNLFITAKHVGGGVGEQFTFRGTNYPVIAAYADPQSDLRIFEVCGIFPAFAELYSGANEVGRLMVVFGRGTRRGVEVVGNAVPGTETKGWKWGAPDGVTRWGTNVVATVSGVIEGLGELLGADFDASGGGNECHLSSGDSGGAIFISDGTAWKLAGINYAVDGPFSTTASGPGFNAAIFDTGGLYQFNAATGTWDYQPPKPVLDTPSSFYATRISANLTWINSIISQHSKASLPPVLESTPDLNQPFAIHPNYTVDELARTISIAAPAANLFLRLGNCLAHEIETTEQANGQWIIHYRP